MCIMSIVGNYDTSCFLLVDGLLMHRFKPLKRDGMTPASVLNNKRLPTYTIWNFAWIKDLVPIHGIS